MTTETLELPECAKCGKRFVYVLADGTVVCRKCGHRTPPKEGKPNA